MIEEEVGDRGADPDPSLVALLESSRRVLVFTGAGISTGSGIPDYRGPQGVWKKRSPVYYSDFLSSEAARIEYWDQKLEGWDSFRDAQPNRVHQAVFKLEEAGKIERVVTQNIDGLHQKAGTSRDRLVEVHGTNAEIQCQSCDARSDPGSHFAWFRENRSSPRCDCGGYLKPATISFGQDLRKEDLERAFEAAAQADLVIALGSTLSVQPAASIPLTALARGVPYVVINRGATDHDAHPGLSLRLEGDVEGLFPPAVSRALSLPETS